MGKWTFPTVERVKKRSMSAVPCCPSGLQQQAPRRFKPARFRAERRDPGRSIRFADRGSTTTHDAGARVPILGERRRSSSLISIRGLFSHASPAIMRS